jgi:hypothetical protein
MTRNHEEMQESLNLPPTIAVHPCSAPHKNRAAGQPRPDESLRPANSAERIDGMGLSGRRTRHSRRAGRELVASTAVRTVVCHGTPDAGTIRMVIHQRCLSIGAGVEPANVGPSTHLFRMVVPLKLRSERVSGCGRAHSRHPRREAAADESPGSALPSHGLLRAAWACRRPPRPRRSRASRAD